MTNLNHNIEGNNKVFFGTNKDTKERIYLSKPTWDCGWYWGFGYLGNNRCHYHLNGYQSKDHCFTLKDDSFKHITENRNICMKDALEADYDLNPVIQNNIWVFCELVLSIYQLRNSAEMYHTGGAHMTTNPCHDLIKNEDQERLINDVVLPQVMQTFWNLITDKVTA